MHSESIGNTGYWVLAPDAVIIIISLLLISNHTIVNHIIIIIMSTTTITITIIIAIATALPGLGGFLKIWCGFVHASFEFFSGFRGRRPSGSHGDRAAAPPAGAAVINCGCSCGCQ